MNSSLKRGALIAIVIAAVLLFSFLDSARASSASRNEVSSGYEQALLVADKFLWCWLKGNAEDADKLLSPRLKSQITYTSWFKMYIKGLSNPHHEEFEVGKGQGRDEHYRFPVTLHELASGMSSGDKTSSTIEVIKSGDSWLINRLPLSSDNPADHPAQ